MTTIATDDLRAVIREELDALVEIRHDIHRHPELLYEEHRTAGVVGRELDRAGVEHRTGLAGGTGVMATLPGAGERAIALRADMDALPIEETSGVPWSSTVPGKMHACGHDGHTTILIGTARVLARYAADGGLPRPVSLFFQPAEEGGAGGERLVEEGCLDGSIIGPPVERVFGLHGWPTLALGQVASRPGPMMAAVDVFELVVRGTGCHAAYPHFGHDPIVASAAVVTALQTIASRTVSPLDSIVVSVTQIHAGTAHNIIPDAVALAGTVRTLRPETRTLARRRVTEIAESVAAAHGCAATLDYHHLYPILRNDPEAVATFEATARAALGPDRVEPMPEPVMGGEDFAYYARAVPSCFFALGLLPPDRDHMPGLHQSDFDFTDAAIPTGIEMFCRLALGA